MPIGPVSSSRPVQVTGEGKANATFERELPGVGKEELYGLLAARFDDLREQLGGKGKLTLDPEHHTARLEGLGAKLVIQAFDDGGAGEAVVGRVVITVKRYPPIYAGKVSTSLRKVMDELPAQVTKARGATWAPSPS